MCSDTLYPRDFMSVQCHLEAAVILACLNHRDRKPGCLADIPRTLSYVTDLAGRHPELVPPCNFIDNEVDVWTK